MGPLARLMVLLRREAPAQADVAREALRRAAATGKEHSVVGLAEEGPRSKITEGEPFAVMPDPEDLRRATGSGVPAFDFHTHPTNHATFSVSPSLDDFGYYSWNYLDPNVYTSAPSELRTLIAMPPTRDTRSAYHLFVTDQPEKVFDARRAENARYELQQAAAKGRFAAIKDDPLFREYFDYGGDMADLLGEASPMGLLGLRARQGRGRRELVLPTGRGITQVPGSTPAELYRRMEPTMLDVLEERRFKRGGLAQVKECSNHG